MGPMLERVKDKFDLLTRNDEETKARRLLATRDRKRRSMRGHARAFASVNLGLLLINLITGLGSGGFFPWFAIVLASWGMGFAIHALGYRDWRRDNRSAIERSEQLIATCDRVSMPPALGAPPAAGSGKPREDPVWRGLLVRCRDAVNRVFDALGPAADPAAVGMRDSLASGLEDVEDLARGAARIQLVLSEIAPSGVGGLEAQLAELQAKLTLSDDARLQEVYRSNMALLDARKRKVLMLSNELERMRASAEGFAMAAENARLDATRLELGQIPAITKALHAPLTQLNQEVEILREVETELEALV